MTITTFIGSCLLSALVAGTGGLVLGSKYEQGKAAIAIQKAQTDKEETEERWRLNTDALTEVKDEELRRISLERDRYLAGMRRAAKRLPETPNTCFGASPAALSLEDAAVALRIASDADELRANYAQCKGFVDSLK